MHCPYPVFLCIRIRKKYTNYVLLIRISSHSLLCSRLQFDFHII
jgi:hypothetical protein